MELLLNRFSSGSEATLGLLFDVTEKPKFLCYTLEDRNVPGPVKVPGETRIPEGRYRILLRNDGAMNQKYGDRFPFHAGMLWLQDVPRFEWIYIHVGNDDDDSLGCILVGDGQVQNITEKGKLISSVSAYARVYPLIVAALKQDKEVWIEINVFA